MTWEIRVGHVLDVLRSRPAESVQCCITSPPYWSLRAYGTEPQVWGGDAGHEHEWGDEIPGDQKGGSGTFNGRNGNGENYARGNLRGSFCPCGAWRGELGSEPTIELFIEHLVEVFREVRRVLRKDGTCWLNIGDSYAGSGKGPKSLGGTVSGSSYSLSTSSSQRSGLPVSRRNCRGSRYEGGNELRKSDRWALHALAVIVVAVALLPAAPSGAQVVQPQPDEWTMQALVEASEDHGVSFQELFVTARCESGGFRRDVVYGPTRGQQGEEGMLQYLHGQRHHLWRSSPWAEYSPFDPVAASKVTAWQWARDPSRKTEWSCWRIWFGRGW